MTYETSAAHAAKGKTGIRGRHVAVAAMSVSAMALMALAGPAHAYDFQTASGWDIDWSNTVKYSNDFRVVHKAPLLSGAANANGNDGDNAFHEGLVSNRVDVLSELTISRDGFGFRASGEGWYDSVYNHSNKNDEPTAEFNSDQLKNHFNQDATHINGKNAMLDDAFVYGKIPLPNDDTALIRVGRHTVLWGESLFDAPNGVAGIQAPIDYAKALGIPGLQAKEVYMPVAQVSTVIPINDTFTIEAYNQFEFRPDLLPGNGGYYLPVDIEGDGTENVILGSASALGGPGNLLLNRAPDAAPRVTHPQFGFELKATLPDQDLDLSAFVVRGDSKAPYTTASTTVFSAGPTIVTNANGTNTNIGSYREVYPEDIWIYGTSASTSIGGANVAGEVSIHDNQPLSSGLSSDGDPLLGGTAGCSVTSISTNVCYPVGKTFHWQASTITLVPRTPLWQGAQFLAEVDGDHLITREQNHAALSAHSNDSTVGFTEQFQMQYFQVLPKLDLTVPLTLGYQWGNSSINPLGVTGGSASIGASFEYANLWSFAIAYNRYIDGAGASTPYFFSDRDNISFNVQRTF